MEPQILTIKSWPQAILHMDADAFFTSCAQATYPTLQGRPVITGKERGIVSAASYEAKAMGVTKGTMLSQARKLCPDAIILPSDYETYSLFSVRMFKILRRFSPDVEEYSIDEAFVNLTGLRRNFHGSYGDIAKKIQDTVNEELNITVSIGVSLTKVLAKLASKHEKPRGLTLIPGRAIHSYLAKLPTDKIWGIGSNTAAFLNKLGVTTALDFARKNEGFVKEHLSKPYQEIWHELNGRSIYPVVRESKSNYQSISKAKTFTPPSDKEYFVFAQLSKNLENACIKARRYQLAAKRLVIFLRTQDFKDTGIELKLNRPTAYPVELLGPLRKGFDSIYKPEILYRSTGVVLSGLVEKTNVQHGLFDDTIRIERTTRAYKAVDTLSDRFGKHTLQHASSLAANREAQHKGERGNMPKRKKQLFKGENRRQRLGLPMLDLHI